MTSAEILAALIKLHAAGARSRRASPWALFPEFRCGTGYARHGARTADVESRIDLLAIHTWPSGDGVIAYEVKVSRSDLLSELKAPMKRRPALRYSNRFYFATPKGLVKPGELPIECGLVEVDEGVAKVVTPAIYRDTFIPTNTFVMSLARRVADLQGS